MVYAVWKRMDHSTREIPLLVFEKCYGFFEVPWIGLLKVGRLGQQLNVPTQGRRVAQTVDERPFSFTVPGLDPQLGIEPGPHCWGADWYCQSATWATSAPEVYITCKFVYWFNNLPQYLLQNLHRFSPPTEGWGWSLLTETNYKIAATKLTSWFIINQWFILINQ